MAIVNWKTKLGSEAQSLVSAYDNVNMFDPSKSVGELVEDKTIREVREILVEFDAELIRLDQMKAAIVSAKKQVKSAVFQTNE